MGETPASDGRMRSLELKLNQALVGTGLQVVTLPENGRSAQSATLKCTSGHTFLRAASSVIKWKSNICPMCRTEDIQDKLAKKLPDPNGFSWIPNDIGLGRGAKPRDLRGARFDSLVATKVVGKHSSGSLLWEVRCDCGNIAIKKSSALCLGKVKSCGCMSGTVKRYKTTAPNKGQRYTLKASGEVFASRKAWGQAVKLAKGNKCEICGWDEASCDVHHRHERGRGGLNTLENAIVLCPNHHRISHEFGMERLLSLNTDQGIA